MTARNEIGRASCTQCGLRRTAEGHDGCLGTLPGNVMNACCGHSGHAEGAYIQYGRLVNGRWVQTGVLRDDAALAEFSRLGVGPKPLSDYEAIAREWCADNNAKYLSHTVDSDGVIKVNARSSIYKDTIIAITNLKIEAHFE